MRTACCSAPAVAAAALLMASVAFAPSSASAQSAPRQPAPRHMADEDDDDESPIPTSVPRSTARLSNGEYVAPLQQVTQPTYVPQSVALTGPRELDEWEDGDRVPPGYHKVAHTRTGLAIAGGTIFASLYLINVAAAAVEADSNSYGGNRSTSFMAVPVVGPLIQMGSTSSSLGNLALGLDAAAQAAGLVMFIAGLTTKTTTLVRNDLASLRLSPTFSGNGGGLAVTGTF